MRAIIFDEDEALAMARRLVADGFDAVLTRERFAGEDDDEDQVWVIATDTPRFLLDVIADQYDAWVEGDEPGPAHPPVELPGMPRRIKRPDLS